jgi:hypothetical protein
LTFTGSYQSNNFVGHKVNHWLLNRSIHLSGQQLQAVFGKLFRINLGVFFQLGANYRNRSRGLKSKPSLTSVCVDQSQANWTNPYGFVGIS